MGMIAISKEKWLSITGFPCYEVSDQGRVRSFWQRGQGKWDIGKTPQRIICPVIRGRKYPAVNLHKDGKAYNMKIHRLVLFSFVGPCPPGHEACHYDGIRTNDFLTNLRWDTPANNGRDTRRHGSKKGEKHNRAKLTDSQVIQIRELAAQRCRQKEIGEMFSVSQHCAWSIIHRRTWTHI